MLIGNFQLQCPSRARVEGAVEYWEWSEMLISSRFEEELPFHRLLSQATLNDQHRDGSVLE